MNGKALYRGRADILNEIKEKAPFYTPEWRYNSDNPDAGTALSFIWADMLWETAAHINDVPETALASLLDALGADSIPATGAEGFLSFEPQPGLAEAVVIPAGTRVLSRGGGEPVLETIRDLTMSSARIAGIYEASWEPDSTGHVGTREGARLFKFSEKNIRQWSFEHPFAFNVSDGGSIRIVFDCGEDTRLVVAALTERAADWELLTIDGWKAVPAARHGDSILLHCEGSPGVGALRFNIRYRDSFGNARIRETCFLPRNSRLAPDAVFSGDLPITDTGFFPFGAQFMVYNTVNISCGEALGKPGAMVELSFSLRTVKLPIEGYPYPEQEWKPVLRPEEIIKIEEREISVGSVSWEYFNGTGWNALPLQMRTDEIFVVGENLETRLIRFICPEDMCAIAVGAHEGLFIRARILSVENAYSMYGSYKSPWMENLKFSYSYDRGVPPERTVSFQNMEEQVVVDFQNAPAISQRLFNESAVYFEVTEPFSSGAILWEFKKKEVRDLPLVWEYRTRAGWESLEVEDGTESFSQSGLMVYNARINPEKTRLFGREAYWIRAVRRNILIGSYSHGPELTGIWENTVPARALIPGSEANRGKHTYTILATSVNGVLTVTNPLPVTGGHEAETETETRLRHTRGFSHGQRAVSRRDIEYLAMEASPDIIKCRCLPNTGADGSRHNRDNCLVIFSHCLEFEALAEHVGRYIRDRSPLSQGKLHVVRPLFVELCVNLCAEAKETVGILKARAEAQNCLQSFLDPQYGYHDGKGWSLGELPTTAQIHNALKDLKTIRRVESLTVSYKPLDKGVSADYRDLRASRFTLPENGEHEVTIVCRS